MALAPSATAGECLATVSRVCPNPAQFSFADVCDTLLSMAKIRVPVSEQPVRNPSGTKATTPFEQGLVQAGMARNPKEARQLVRDLLQALKGAGFSADKNATIDRRLASQLTSFQKAQGLPVTGKLDGATIQSLRELGLWPGAAPTKGEGVPGTATPDAGSGAGGGRPTLETAARNWLNFAPSRGGAAKPTGVGGPQPDAHSPAAADKAPVWQHLRTQTQGLDAHRDVAAKSEIPELLQRLASLGFTGAGSGKNGLKSALRRFQQAMGLPPSGRLDAATLNKLTERESALPLRQQAEAKNGQLTPESSRDSARGAEQPRGAGTSEPQSGTGSGGAGGAGAGLDPSDGVYLSVGQGDEKGWVEDDANAPAGDEDRENRRRGHAMLEELEEGEEGHYEMPPLSVQIFKSLEQIMRIDDARGATTYSWDVTFYRPGIYGRRQPAEALWHIGVEEASPFDPIWQQAQEALMTKLAASEPEAESFTWEQMQAALRRARVRSSRTDDTFPGAAAASLARRKI